MTPRQARRAKEEKAKKARADSKEEANDGSVDSGLNTETPSD